MALIAFLVCIFTQAHTFNHAFQCTQFVEALGAVAYEAGMTFEDVLIALGCRGPVQLTPEGSQVCIVSRGSN